MTDPHDQGGQSAGPTSSAEQILARAGRLWRACLFLPFAYLGLGVMVERVIFHRLDSPGLFPLENGIYNLMISLLGLGALGAQIALLVIRWRFSEKTRRFLVLRGAEAAQRDEWTRAQVADFYWRRTLFMVMCADSPSGLGLIAFVIQGDWRALVGFCVCSYFLYAQAYPRAELPGPNRRPVA